MSLFGTAGIRGDVRERVTPRVAAAVGAAVAEEAGSAPIIVGRDGRTTGPALAAAAAAGAASAGASIRRAGIVPTPTLAFATRRREAHGIMLTASHNPPEDNGLKLFARGEEYDAAAETRVTRRIETEGHARPADWTRWEDPGRRSGPQLERYRRAVVRYATDLGTPPDGTVVLDCGCGVAGRVAPRTLRDLGVDVLALNANVDGHFPARASKPTADSLGTIQRVLAERSDAVLGLAHDGDGDRIVVLDAAGDPVHEDTVVTILAERYVRDSDATDPVVVTTPNASGRIDERVRASGGRVERVRLGGLHEGIADSDGTVVFAAEPWKHLHSAFGPWIDGIASAAVFTALVGAAGLSSLRRPVTERPYEKTSVDCPEAHKADAMTRLERVLPERFPEAAVDTTHGIRLSWDDAWTLVRPSGTEPYLRVYVESETAQTMLESVVTEITAVVDAEQRGGGVDRA